MATPKLTKPIEKVAHITRVDIERYEKLGDEARGYERLAKAKRTEQGELKTKLMGFVEAKKKGKNRTVDRSGYRLSITTVAKSVSWVKEFTAQVGFAAAEKLRETAGTRDVLKVKKL